VQNFAKVHHRGDTMANTVAVVKKDNRGGPRPNSGRRPKRGKTTRKDLRAPLPVVVEAIKVGAGEFSDGILTMIDEYMATRTRSVQDTPPEVGATVFVYNPHSGNWVDAVVCQDGDDLYFEQPEGPGIGGVEYWRPQPLAPGETYPLFGAPQDDTEGDDGDE
jgi:hypothetical protein